ncbi:MAG: XrtV sorting system accessory protein [Bradyrhizobium sp.]
MVTPFDFLTVACFFGLIVAFVAWTGRDTRTLLHLLISAAAFAIANQVGNRGLTLLALVLIFAGAGYALLIIRRKV